MKHIIAFISIVLIFKSSFINSTPVNPSDANVNINIADITGDEVEITLLRQQIEEKFGGLKGIDLPNSFAKRPRGGNDDPTVNIHLVMAALSNQYFFTLKL